jgi:hypothetical protein
MKNNILEHERNLFEDYIKRNWDKKHHNFSLNDDGDYFYNAMDDAFMVWLAAKGWEYPECI